MPFVTALIILISALLGVGITYEGINHHIIPYLFATPTPISTTTPYPLPIITQADTPTNAPTVNEQNEIMPSSTNSVNQPVLTPTIPPQIAVYTATSGLIYCDPGGADAVKSADTAYQNATAQYNSCMANLNRKYNDCTQPCYENGYNAECVKNCDNTKQAEQSVCDIPLNAAQTGFTSTRDKFCK